jgi:hypothetical protein
LSCLALAWLVLSCLAQASVFAGAPGERGVRRTETFGAGDSARNARPPACCCKREGVGEAHAGADLRCLECFRCALASPFLSLRCLCRRCQYCPSCLQLVAIAPALTSCCNVHPLLPVLCVAAALAAKAWCTRRRLWWSWRALGSGTWRMRTTSKPCPDCNQHSI